MSFPRQYIDVETAPPGAMMGCTPRDVAFGSEVPIFEESFPLIPRSEWKDRIDAQENRRQLVNRIKDQNGEPSCTSNAVTGCYEYIYNQQIGETLGEALWVELSPISVYRFVGSPNSGSSVSANYRRMRDIGALPVNTDRNRKLLAAAGLNPQHTHPANGYRVRMPDGWEETAQLFRITEAYDIDSVDGFISALLSGWCVHYGRSGHSIFGAQAVYEGSTFYCEYANSWGNWGDQGFGRDSESYLKRTSAAYGAYAYRAVTIPEAIFQLYLGLLNGTKQRDW